MSLSVDGYWKAGYWATTYWADGYWGENVAASTAKTTGAANAAKPPPVYVVEVQGVEYAVESLAQANELIAANTPNIEVVSLPAEPLPKFTITSPDPRPAKTALPRAPSGIRKLI